MKKQENNLDLVTVLTLLRDNGIYYCGCYYGGGGDSGEINTHIFNSEKFKETFDAGDIDADYGDEGDILFEHPKLKDIMLFLEGIYLSHLNNIEDWWNNEGGYGTLMLDTATGDFKNNNHCYKTETDDYSHTGVFQGE
jgi:hypothetical protein